MSSCRATNANGEWRASHVTRLVRARVALYLRLMRRVEAAERWHSPPFDERCSWADWMEDESWVQLQTGVWSERYSAQPWRPLWTSAPPHAPGVTARMRRGRVEALGREAPGPEVV